MLLQNSTFYNRVKTIKLINSPEQCILLTSNTSITSLCSIPTAEWLDCLPRARPFFTWWEAMQLFTNYFGGTGVIGCTAWFFAVCRPNSNLVYFYCMTLHTAVVCPSAQCGRSVLVAEWLDSSAVSTAQTLAHAAGESILCCKGWRHVSSQMTLGRTCNFLCFCRMVMTAVSLVWLVPLSCLLLHHMFLAWLRHQICRLAYPVAWLLWQHKVITSPRVTACYCDEAKTSETVLHFCILLVNPSTSNLSTFWKANEMQIASDSAPSWHRAL